jgi:transcriptional regulator MraZ
VKVFNSGPLWGKSVYDLASASVSMPTHDNELVYYNSLYRHGVDEKRRVQVPAKWRPARPDFQFTLILWPKGSEKEACLLVLGPDEWRALVQKIKEMPYSDPTTQTLRRILGTKSDLVMLDKAGRICIPELMARAVAIEKEAVLVGLLDRFEIWNPERYATTSAGDEQLLTEAMKLI